MDVVVVLLRMLVMRVGLHGLVPLQLQSNKIMPMFQNSNGITKGHNWETGKK